MLFLGGGKLFCANVFYNRWPKSHLSNDKFKKKNVLLPEIFEALFKWTISGEMPSFLERRAACGSRFHSLNIHMSTIFGNERRMFLAKSKHLTTYEFLHKVSELFLIVSFGDSYFCVYILRTIFIFTIIIVIFYIPGSVKDLLYTRFNGFISIFCTITTTILERHFKTNEDRKHLIC